MPRSFRFSRWVAAFGALATLGRPSFAAPRADAEPLAIRYERGEGCPGPERFADALFARTDRARPALEGEPARTLTVAVHPGVASSEGELTIGNADGTTTRRVVTGETCDDVVTALALIAALTVDPDARTERMPAPGIQDGPRESPAEAAPATAPGVPPAVPFLPPNAPVLEAPAPARFAVTGVAQGLAIGGLVPAWAWGAGAALELAGVDPASAALRIGAVFATTHPREDDGVGARIRWFLGRIEGCPGRLRLADGVLTEACGALDAGILSTLGSGLDHPATAIKPWVSPEALVRVRFRLSEALGIEASGGAIFPLRRYPLRYDPGTGGSVKELYRPAIAGAVIALGVGYRFP